MKKINILISCAAILTLVACKKNDIEEAVAPVAPEVPPEVLAQQWTAEAFAVLSGRLMETIEAEGHVAAIHVCSMEAAELLDGVADAHGAVIRRVTDRPRNLANQADARDLQVMALVQAMINEGETLEPVVDSDVSHVVRLPIRIAAPLCLTCHGNPETDIAPETLAAIRTRYPADRARGYRDGELRGLWRVEIPKASAP